MKDHKYTSRQQITRVLMIILPYIIVVGVFQLIACVLIGVDILAPAVEFSAWQKLVLTLFSSFGTLLVVFLFKKHVDKEPFNSLGLGSIHIWDIFLGLLIGFVIMVTGFFILVYMNEITYSGNKFLPGDFILSFCTFALVAISEELFVRGYILGNLVQSMNKYKALIISSVFFSLMHGLNSNYSWFAAIELFLGGMLLGLSYIYVPNLGFPIALHFSWNFFQGTIFGFNVSGSRAYSLITQVRSEDTIWNGGPFGFEGSAISVIFQILAIIVIYLLFNKRKPNLDVNNVQISSTR